MATALDTGLAPLWPLSVERYHAMIDAGILGPEDAVELLDGVIVSKMPKYPPHVFSTGAAKDELGALIPAGWYVNEQGPVTLAGSEPEPDITVIRGNRRDFLARHPGPADIGLIVEIADSSLKRDRMFKKHIYAEAGIPVYWILDLNSRRLEAFCRPRDGRYTECTVYKPGDSVPVVLDSEPVGAVAVARLLP